MNVCENLKAIRELSGFTQVELAERIGTNERSIRYFEAGLKNPSVITLMKLAKALNCSLEDITGFKFRKED